MIADRTSVILFLHRTHSWGAGGKANFYIRTYLVRQCVPYVCVCVNKSWPCLRVFITHEMGSTQKHFFPFLKERWQLPLGRASVFFFEFWAATCLLDTIFIWGNDWQTNCVFSDSGGLQTFSQKWSKWTCYFKEYLLQMIKFQLSQEN